MQIFVLIALMVPNDVGVNELVDSIQVAVVPNVCETSLDDSFVIFDRILPAHRYSPLLAQAKIT